MKVFGIGLSRTGTSSLTHALEILGYKTKHFPLIRQNIEEANYNLEIMETYDAATDASIAAIFPHLMCRYPQAKFILTVRDKDEWLDSCENYFTLRDTIRRQQGVLSRAQFWRLFVFGCYEFNRERFSYVYDRHIREVEWSFANERDNLLIIDICTGEGWEKLCPFLDKPLPETPFPFKHSFKQYVQKAAKEYSQIVQGLVSDNFIS